MKHKSLTSIAVLVAAIVVYFFTILLFAFLDYVAKGGSL